LKILSERKKKKRTLYLNLKMDAETACSVEMDVKAIMKQRRSNSLGYPLKNITSWEICLKFRKEDGR